ncbi:hypothetical protein FQZ97_864650 [compost metagenome]
MQGGIQLAVLDQLDRLGVRQELDLAHVFIAQTRRGEDRPGIQLGAGLRRADRDALALEVGQGGDAGFLVGDDLDVVRVGAGDRPQLLQRRLEAGVFHPVPGVGDRIAEGQGQFATAALQQVEVFHRGLGRLHRGFRAVDAIAVELRQAHTDRVVHAAGAAGEDVDEGWRGKCRGAGGQGRGSGEQAETLGQSHGVSPSLLWLYAAFFHCRRCTTAAADRQVRGSIRLGESGECPHPAEAWHARGGIAELGETGSRGTYGSA